MAQIKVVYHVNDPASFPGALKNVSNHLAADPGARIVLICNGGAISALTTAGGHADKITDLAGKGVTFDGCANSMRGAGLEQKDLVPGVEVVPAGVAELARLQCVEGYAYIKP
ncbi:DsrEFH-like protein [Hyaloraphidium curvatum]|nr:DsrEFH-like protein [Hyaloraphidium curvatum]